MNTDTLISMMLAPILIKLAEQLIGWITERINTNVDKLSRKFANPTVKIYGQQKTGWNTDRDVLLISEISTRLIKTGCKIQQVDVAYLQDEYKKVATGIVDYDGFVFKFNSDVISDERDSYTEYTLTITHRDISVIHKFIEECASKIAHKNDFSQKQVFYGQSETDGSLIYRSLVLRNTITFDDVFFPQKENVIKSIDGLLEGRLPKLSFYLHGEPGCGKSSICKAIAAKTGYSVVEIKLSNIDSDDTLRNIVFDESLQVSHQGCNTYRKVDVSRRIYLFEDIDAECDVVLKRDTNDVPELSSSSTMSVSAKKSDSVAMSNTMGKKSLTDTLCSITSTQKLTLSGILNVLDGILSIRGIVIITTNHPEKLDPALVRYGRVTHNIRMGKLSEECAGQLVRKFHPEFTGVVPDLRYTPAELEAICQTNNLPGVMEAVRG